MTKEKNHGIRNLTCTEISVLAISQMRRECFIPSVRSDLLKMKMHRDPYSEIPKGWRWVKLGEVCEVVTGATPRTDDPSNWDGEILWATPNDMGKLLGFTISNTERRISEKGLQSCSARLLPAGSVLLTTRAPIGYVAINLKPMCTNQGFKSLVPSSQVHNWFLFFAIKYFVPALQTMGRGQTFTEISKKQVQTFIIPLPPLPEQRRIAAKIQELMQDIDRARAACQKELEAAQILPAAYFREVFESEKAKYWERKKLIEVCEKPEYGYTASAENSAVGPKLVRITDIQDGKVDWSKVPYCRYDKKAERFLLKLGDILVARTGATTGKSFIIKDKAPKAIFASYLIRVRVGNALLPGYLYFFLQTDMYWNQVAINKRGGSQPNMNARLLSDIVMPVPTIQQQHSIVSSLQEKIIHTESVLKLIKNKQALIYAFPQVILSKAFRGNL